MSLHKVNFTEDSVGMFGKASLVIQMSQEVLLITKENTDCFRVCECLSTAVEISIQV